MAAKTKCKAQLLSGNEACVQGALVAGIRFFAGYPITPSTEVAEGLAEELPKIGGRFIQMEDEIASMGAVIGASLAGLKSMTATSGPGFSLKQENIGFAAMTEVPCVVVNVQRYGPSTGLPTSPAQGDIMQARWGTHGDHPVVALMPASVRETFDLTVEAVNLAEELRTPVIILLDEVVGHMRERVELPAAEDVELFNRVKPTESPDTFLPYKPAANLVPPMPAYGDGYRFHATGLVHDETGFPCGKGADGNTLVRRLQAKVEQRQPKIARAETFQTEDAEIVIVAAGSVARSARAAVKEARAQGIKLGLVRPITAWPFPEEAIDSVAQTAKALIVAEMNLGQMILEVERIAAGRAPVFGLNRIDAELITPEDIIVRAQEVTNNVR
ncbi:MAG TPA: 2-oxoacid:acceptor oxidoreductase subunit alpha [Firmicutes bacterium]|nr:2-oxoacid:acceptor oxidoreductase subunit alpha [Bacillota bacterium]